MTADGGLNAIETQLDGEAGPGLAVVVPEQWAPGVFLGEAGDDFEATVGGKVDRPGPAAFGLLAGNDGPVLVELEVPGFELFDLLGRLPES